MKTATKTKTPEVPVLVVGALGRPTDQAFCQEEPDGSQFIFNASMAARIGAEDPDSAVWFDLWKMGVTEAVILERYKALDKQFALSDACDLTRPVVFVPYKGAHLLIDGWHRAYKAAVTRTRLLPAYLLTPEQAQRCLMCHIPAGMLREMERGAKPAPAGCPAAGR